MPRCKIYAIGKGIRSYQTWVLLVRSARAEFERHEMTRCLFYRTHYQEFSCNQLSRKISLDVQGCCLDESWPFYLQTLLSGLVFKLPETSMRSQLEYLLVSRKYLYISLSITFKIVKFFYVLLDIRTRLCTLGSVPIMHYLLTTDPVYIKRVSLWICLTLLKCKPLYRQWHEHCTLFK